MKPLLRVLTPLALAVGAFGMASGAGAEEVATTGVTTPKVEFLQTSSAVFAQARDLSPYGMYLAADWVVKGVILILVAASLITWTICIAKCIELAAERRTLKRILPKLLQAGRLNSNDGEGAPVVVDMLVSAEDEIAASSSLSRRLVADGLKERIGLRLERLEIAMRRRAGSGLAILAIIASAAPFVGLFGTVWGIMNSFIGISESKTTSLAVVAPGIAEALLTTAFGLVAAIPAVVIYNLLSRLLAAFRGDLGDVSAAVLCVAGREIDRLAPEA